MTTLLAAGIVVALALLLAFGLGYRVGADEREAALRRYEDLAGTNQHLRRQLNLYERSRRKRRSARTPRSDT